MNKLNSVIRTILFLLGAGFFTLILYVSILGENHKIDYLVTHFFDQIKTKNYDAVCSILNTESIGERPGEPSTCMDTGFLLETAFLKRYDLLGHPDYTVMVRREPFFWIPFVSGDSISVSVAFSVKKKNLIEKIFRSADHWEYISDFITVSRSKGSWEITSINLKESSLYPLFTTLSLEVDLNRFAQPTEQGFILKENTISPETLSDMDRRLLDFSLFKLTHENKQ